MYTRVFNHDGSSYILETRDFNVRDLEEYQTYVSNLPANVLSAEEICQILDSDAESGNYRSLAGIHKKLYHILLKTFEETTIDEDNAADIARMFLLSILDMGGIHNN